MIQSITLIRHGQSKGNTGEVCVDETPDCDIPLSSLGIRQAVQRGEELGQPFWRRALIFYSPYLRTRQTLYYMLQGAGLMATQKKDVPEGFVRVFEDPRLRELERGYSPSAWQQELRAKNRWFFYRFQNGGESPADACDRADAAIDGQIRQAARKRIGHLVLTTHGTFTNAYVARFMHLTVEQFCNLETPDNCGVVRIERYREGVPCDYARGDWMVHGLKFRAEQSYNDDPLVWCSDAAWEKP